jgi:hypothetical protein
VARSSRVTVRYLSSRLHDETMMGKQSSTRLHRSMKTRVLFVAVRCFAWLRHQARSNLSNRSQPALLGKGVYIQQFVCLIVPNLNAADAVFIQWCSNHAWHGAWHAYPFCPAASHDSAARG